MLPLEGLLEQLKILFVFSLALLLQNAGILWSRQVRIWRQNCLNSFLTNKKGDGNIVTLSL